MLRSAGPGDVLAAPARRPVRPIVITAAPGLWIEHRGSGFAGVLEDVDRRMVSLRDDAGLLRLFPLTAGGFRLVETGAVITLTPAGPPPDVAPPVTASGALRTDPAPPRVARADRILVEGTHDAELIEKVWGDELRPEGIVVEPIGGVDHLVDEVAARAPGPHRRLGILLDHMVPGSKETRAAAEVGGPHVLVAGHQFVDVWQAVRPAVLGMKAWPQVPRDRPWKDGICQALGAEHPAVLWRRILGAVTSYRDLEPSFVGAVESLLDYLLEPPGS